MAFDRDALEPEWKTAFAWIEANLGGRIVDAEKQPRWRPAYAIDLERDGEVLPLYFRGDRGGTGGVYPLEHEMHIFQLLEAHGLLVPHVYGLCPEPRGMVLSRVPGRPDLGTAETDAEQEAVLAHFMEQLAGVHAIPMDEVRSLGIDEPTSDAEIALADMGRYEAQYRAHKRRPDPLIEFVVKWARRHVPERHSSLRLIQGDAGQFIFEDGRVTAMLDFELACLGDPLSDLAAMRVRDIFEPLGNLPRGFARYAEVTGTPIDVKTVSYHTARFAIGTPMSVAHVVADPQAGTDLCLYTEWYAFVGRMALDAICEYMEIQVAPAERPEPVRGQHDAAHEVLVASLGGEARCAEYQDDVPRRLACYLRDVARLGPALDMLEIEEAAALVGRRPASVLEADAEVEALVLEAGSERDEELLHYLVHRQQRRQYLIESALLRTQNRALQPVVSA